MKRAESVPGHDVIDDAELVRGWLPVPGWRARIAVQVAPRASALPIARVASMPPTVASMPPCAASMRTMDRIDYRIFRVDANHGCIDAASCHINAIHGSHECHHFWHKCHHAPHQCHPWISSILSFAASMRTMVRVDAW